MAKTSFSKFMAARKYAYMDEDFALSTEAIFASDLVNNATEIFWYAII